MKDYRFKKHALLNYSARVKDHGIAADTDQKPLLNVTNDLAKLRPYQDLEQAGTLHL